MTRWAAFVGLTALVVTLLLALARLSQRLVDDDPLVTDARADGVPPSRHPRRAGTDPVIPRFEPPETAGATSPAVREFTTGQLLANVALTQGLFGGLLLAGAAYFEVPRAALGLAGGPLATGWRGVAVGVGFGCLLWTGNEVAGAVADATGAGYDESVRESLAPDSVGGWLVLLVAVLPTIAVVEEFIFRAALVGAVGAGLGLSPWLLAVGSSLAFGVAHGAQGRVGVAVTGGLGFALAAGFVLTESLLVVAVAHYLVNALEFGVHEGFGVGKLSEVVYVTGPTGEP